MDIWILLLEKLVEFPEVSRTLLETINPTHIYLSHLHWDHYHGPSLRKFHDIDPTILLPKHFNRRMKGDLLKDFKFSNIKELIMVKDIL